MNNNSKPKFWSKNKGVIHDGVTDVTSVQNLQGGNNNNNNYHNQNNKNSNCDNQNQNQNNQQSCNQTQFFPHNNNNNNYNNDYDQNQKFTSFHEPLDDIFQKLVDDHLMIFPNTQPFDENQTKSKWYRENEY